MKQCAKCGTTYPDEASFCGRCGAALVAAPPAIARGGPLPLGIQWPILGLGAAGGALAFVIQNAVPWWRWLPGGIGSEILFSAIFCVPMAAAGRILDRGRSLAFGAAAGVLWGILPVLIWRFVPVPVEVRSSLYFAIGCALAGAARGLAQRNRGQALGGAIGGLVLGVVCFWLPLRRVLAPLGGEMGQLLALAIRGAIEGLLIWTGISFGEQLGEAKLGRSTSRG